ncbi:MAG: EcsC family protein [Bacteroidota bacterium]
MKTFLLNTLYPRALDGLPVLGSPQEFAQPYLDKVGPKRSRAEQMVRAHLAAASATGFVSGLGGWVTLPITIPANLAGVALVQLHMTAAVAHLGGHTLGDPAIQERIVGCLIGDPDHETERRTEDEMVDRFGVKFAEKGLQFVATQSWQLAKFATQRSLTNRLARRIPLVGGVIGGLSDLYNTRVVARCALDTFIESGGLDVPHAGDGLPATPADLEPAV